MAHIVHVCPRYFPARGGVELFFLKLSEELSRRGHSVSIWTTDARTVLGFTSASEYRLACGREEINGVEVWRFPVRYIPAQRYVRTAAHILPFGTRWKSDTLRWTPWVPALTRAATRHAGRVDVVHAAGLPYSSVLFAGLRLAEQTGARLVMSPFTHIAPPGPAGARMRRAYLSPLNVQLLARADRLFVQTDMERRTLKDAGVSAVPQTIVGLGVDADECTGGSGQRFRRDRGLPDDAIVVGHLANKSWDKGTVDLLDAAERLWDKGSRFAVVLAGSEMRSFVRRWVRVRFRDRIVNLGTLSDEERRDFYAAIDIFVLPSYVESFGLSSLEAALNRVPVVAYNHGGPAQIFRDGVSAVLPPAGNIDTLAGAIEILTEQPSERRRLGEAGAALAREYTWRRALDVAVADYDGLLRDGRRQGRGSSAAIPS